MTMDPGHMQATLDSLHLTQPAAARMLGVSERTIRYWVSGERPIPEGVWDDLLDLERRTSTAESDMWQEAQTAGQTITVYPTDEQLWEAEPWWYPWPARWHRATAAAVVAEHPYMTLAYPDEA